VSQSSQNEEQELKIRFENKLRFQSYRTGGDIYRTADVTEIVQLNFSDTSHTSKERRRKEN
jgi:hypothetical protein